MGPRKKVVLVGITASGKTSLYNCISGEVFESAYTPTTVEDSGQKNISINGQKVIEMKNVEKLGPEPYIFSKLWLVGAKYINDIKSV